jgi:hypothetical protein
MEDLIVDKNILIFTKKLIVGGNSAIKNKEIDKINPP